VKKFILMLSTTFALTGCLMTREEIADEEQRKAVQQQVSSLQKNTAETQNHYSEVSDEIRELRGRVETVENRQTGYVKEREKLQSSVEAQLAELGKKQATLQEEMQKLNNQISFLTQELGKVAAAKAAAPAPAPVAKGSDKKTDNYKLAEETFAKKDFKQAILEYQKYRENFPNGKRFANATYKIGLSFKALGMRDEAKTFFEEVQSKFPDTALAKLAKEQMKSK